MTSDQKRATNRRNGRQSRGPKTEAGKARSSQNARRHGFNTIHRNNPLVAAEIRELAVKLCCGDDHPLLFEQAVSIAESAVLIRLIDREEVLMLERLRDGDSLPVRWRGAARAECKAALKRADMAYQEYSRLAKRNPQMHHLIYKPDPNPSDAVWPAPEHRKARGEFAIVQVAMPDLIRLHRYRRRAWSSQQRAMARFIRIKEDLRLLRQDRAHSPL
jgi:hypothetical protein